MNMTESLLKVVHETLAESGTIARHYFRQSLAVTAKRDLSPVTRADQEIEAAMRKVIHQYFPEHSVVGEEGEDQLGTDSYTWTLDPIDGTKSFISGLPLFGTLICVSREEQFLIGAIDIPILNERWIGVLGQGSTFNGNPCKASDVTDIGSATLFSTEPNMFNTGQAERLKKLESAVRLRRYGGDCYSYGLLASGHIDLVVEASLHPYDWMPAVPIIQEAGGVITDWQGNALHRNSEGSVIAAGTPELHSAALALLTGAKH